MQLGEGPCMRAYKSGELVQIPDLWVDKEFPLFSPRAVGEQLERVRQLGCDAGRGQQPDAASAGAPAAPVMIYVHAA